MKKILHGLLFALAVSFSFQVSSQMDSLTYREKYDSLLALPTDTNKVRALNDLAWTGKYINTEITQEIANTSLALAQKNGYTAEAAFALKLRGILCDEQGLYPQAIDEYLKAIEEYEKIGDSLGIAKCEANVGMIYRNMKKQDEAIPYFIKSARTFSQYNFAYGIQLCYANIGICYMDLGKLDSAEYYYSNANDIMQASGRIDPDVYGNMGLLYSLQGDKQKSREYLEMCIKIIEEQSPDDQTLKVWYQNLGAVYLDLGMINESVKVLEKAVKIAGTNTFTREMTYLLKTLSHAYELKGDYKEALTYYKQLTVVNDSIYNADNLAQINDVKAKYESEKQALQIEALNKEKKIEETKRQREEEKVLYVSIGIGLAGVLIVILVVGFLGKVKDNRMIREQNHEIESQRLSLQEKNQEILSSIEYAKRIQTAILPPEKLVKEYLTDSFIFYRPKDIVAGDFYWMDRVGDQLLFAVADCTGHGVPGAMVSVVCHNALNRAVREFGMTSPGDVLNKARELIYEQFAKSESNVRDGMDIALVSMKTGENTDRNLQFCGANNPLWIVRGEEIIELKAMKQPVGKHENMKPFETQLAELQKGDLIYLFSDGYSDQFGGDNGKKFKSSSLKKLLLSIKEMSMSEQRTQLEQTFDSWKKGFEQIDDICLIGVRIS